MDRKSHIFCFKAFIPYLIHGSIIRCLEQKHNFRIIFNTPHLWKELWHSKAVTGGVLQKKLLLKISQDSEENTFVGVFINERLQHRCFPVNIANFLRAPILKNICEQLLLDIKLQLNSTLSLCFNMFLKICFLGKKSSSGQNNFGSNEKHEK